MANLANLRYIAVSGCFRNSLFLPSLKEKESGITGSKTEVVSRTGCGIVGSLARCLRSRRAGGYVPLSSRENVGALEDRCHWLLQDRARRGPLLVLRPSLRQPIPGICAAGFASRHHAEHFFSTVSPAASAGHTVIAGAFPS